MQMFFAMLKTGSSQARIRKKGCLSCHGCRKKEKRQLEQLLTTTFFASSEQKKNDHE